MPRSVPKAHVLITLVGDDSVLLERLAVEVAAVGDEGHPRAGQLGFGFLVAATLPSPALPPTTETPAEPPRPELAVPPAPSPALLAPETPRGPPISGARGCRSDPPLSGVAPPLEVPPIALPSIPANAPSAPALPPRAAARLGDSLPQAISATQAPSAQAERDLRGLHPFLRYRHLMRVGATATSSYQILRAGPCS